MEQAANRSALVLIVDDMPDNLQMLHDALDAAGHTVLVATHGEAALQRARLSLPDVILLDAVMPGMDGFEVARRLKQDFVTRAIPIVFMTGLTDSEHVVAAFAAGGADYVTKPLRPPEVLARIAAHTANARQMQQASSALDAFGQATLALNPDSGRLVWQTALARQLLQRYFGVEDQQAPESLWRWARLARQARLQGEELPGQWPGEAGQKLLASFHLTPGEPEWLVVLREEGLQATLAALIAAFRLTQREAEVLHWLSLGKTNRDIADILGMSPRTVNKHLEHVFAKLGVETRTSAAAMALGRGHA
ncbi:LuxR family transcriptional regulator [Aquitalea magnusonii]|nr:LuxR family transcriptional regulator [Aquitalea magnusonii]